MFGYLQVGDVLRTAGRADELPKWLHDHPHLLPKRVDEPSNVIYVAADRLSLEPTLPGAGVFTASPAEGNDTLVLTAPDRSRSWWKLPRHVFGTRPFSFHSEDSWQGGEFRSASIGQEFVVDADDLVRGWVADVIRTGMRP
jgi:hypothetical protein